MLERQRMEWKNQIKEAMEAETKYGADGIGTFIGTDILLAINRKLITLRDECETLHSVERATRGLLQRIPAIYREEDFPESPHEGSCHPDAGCDDSCSVRHNMSMYNNAVWRIKDVLAKLDKRES